MLQPAGEEKQQAKKARKANTQAESVLRQVRATAGKDANGKAELWWYVPENASDQSNKRRRGWWLYELSASGKEGCFEIQGGLEHIQKTKKSLQTDVFRIRDFPFKQLQVKSRVGTRWVKQTKMWTARALTDTELKQAEAALIQDQDDDSDDPEYEPTDGDQAESENDMTPKRVCRGRAQR